MEQLKHGILIVKISPFSYNLIGFYFTPNGGETKCLLLDPSINKSVNESQRSVPLSDILLSGAFSKISYRELIDPNDSKRFKFALVNMQSSFHFNNFENVIIDNSWDMYAKTYIDYISKAVGQNPAERIRQCSGECYVGEVSDIKSYDPFAPIKIYHRDMPVISEKDKLRIKAWTDFFTVSYLDLRDSVYHVTVATQAVKPFSEISKSEIVKSEIAKLEISNSDIFREEICKGEICDSGCNKNITTQPPSDTLFQAFLNNIIDDGNAAGDSNPIKLPLSFRVHPGYIFSGDIDNDEKMLTTWGLNIYDGACWEIALWLLKDSQSSLLDEIRSMRKTTQFASIIGNNVNSQKSNQYLFPLDVGENIIPHGNTDPSSRTIVYPYDPNGFSFKVISNYYSYDSMMIIPQQWNYNAKYWNNFRPTCGENAWFFGIAPFVKNFNMSNFRGYPGFIHTLFNTMDANGGFYHSPINNTNNRWSLSSENNISMYGTLSHMKAFVQNSINKDNSIGISIGQLTSMINGIERLFTTLSDRQNFFFYQGKTWDGSWKINTGGYKVDPSVRTGITPFKVTSDHVYMPEGSTQSYVIPVDVQIWGICSLQPKVIDRIFGTIGASLMMWNNLKQTCGRFDKNNKLQGFGYNNIKCSYDQGIGSVISSERTFSAMIACKVLKEHYGMLAETTPYSISSDLIEMETFIYTANSGNMGDNHLLYVSNDEAYFNYANLRTQTGFGQVSNPIPSITSTAWHIFYIKSFNPFVPKGLILR